MKPHTPSDPRWVRKFRLSLGQDRIDRLLATLPPGVTAEEAEGVDLYLLGRLAGHAWGCQAEEEDARILYGEDFLADPNWRERGRRRAVREGWLEPALGDEVWMGELC